MNEAHPRFSVIQGRRRVAISEDVFRPMSPGPQATLFPGSKTGVVVFVCFPDIQDREFIELMETAQPGFVIDLRVVPRFDVGRMNRDRAFDLFEAAGTRYLDLTGILMKGATHQDVMQSFKDLLSSGMVTLSRPVVFMLSRPDTSVATDSEILDALAASGKRAEEVYQLPAFA